MLDGEGVEEQGRQAPGRPRDPEVDDAIQAATMAVLAEAGYEQLSIEAVAQRAGVSRPTIYRRYENKTDLVIDAISRVAARDSSRFEGISPRPPSTGSLAGDLEELYLALASSFDAFVEQGIMPGFLADLIAHPNLAQRFFSEYLDVAQMTVRSVFAAAAERGEIAEGLLPEVVISSLIGAYIYHRFVICQTFGADERRLVAGMLAEGLKAQKRS